MTMYPASLPLLRRYRMKPNHLKSIDTDSESHHIRFLKTCGRRFLSLAKRAYRLQSGFGKNSPSAVRLRYAELICNDFELLVTRKIFGKTASLKQLVFWYRRRALMGEANTYPHNVRGINDYLKTQG